MRNTVMAMLMLGVAGCAGLSQSTQDFYAVDKQVTRRCFVRYGTEPKKLYDINRETGRSAITEVAMCYQRDIDWETRNLAYQHRKTVMDYADYLVKLAQLHDEGGIDTQTALAQFRDAQARFNTVISRRDAQVQASEFREFASFLGQALITVATVAAAVEAQRAAYRPVITHCGPSGPFNTTSVTCISR